MIERKMKDSGIPWVGMIPEEWKVKPIGSYFKEINHINSDELETNALQFKMGKIISKKDGDSKYTPETLAAYNIVYPGVIMINGLNLSFDLISQRIALVKDNGVITSTYLAIALKDKGVPDYFNYLFKSFDYQKVFHSWGKGLRATLSFNILKSENLVFPPLAEQEAIATWLDEKCGDIDELIEVEQKMIEALEAYRQALITETVTRGLNPEAPMRQTGISWIPEIPEHWNLCRLKDVGQSRNGATFSPMDVTDEDNGTLVLRSCNIKDGKLVLDDCLYVENIDSKYYVQKGDILICSRNGSVKLVGKCALIDQNIDAGFGAFMLIFRTNQNPVYFNYLLNFIIETNRHHFSTTTINQLTNSMLANFSTLIPPITEQQAIADYLDTKCKEIDELIAVKREKIETLKQYRQSIIFEAVTGKIQVS